MAISSWQDLEELLGKIEVLMDGLVGNITDLEDEKVKKFEKYFTKAPVNQKDKGYYFFTSDGKKIPNKWDSFDGTFYPCSLFELNFTHHLSRTWFRTEDVKA